MKARNWTTWERHLPSARVETRTGAATLCLKPWDQILPEEGVKERMGCTEPLWRTWEEISDGGKRRCCGALALMGGR